MAVAAKMWKYMNMLQFTIKQNVWNYGMFKNSLVFYLDSWFGRDLNIDLIIKRDDATAGTELGGNKVRKLEFLLADALHGGYDSVITIGGEQSNHCRATVSFVPFHFAFVALRRKY